MTAVGKASAATRNSERLAPVPEGAEGEPSSTDMVTAAPSNTQDAPSAHRQVDGSERSSRSWRPSLLAAVSEDRLLENARLRRDVAEVRHSLSSREAKYKLELEQWQGTALRLQLELAEASQASDGATSSCAAVEKLTKEVSSHHQRYVRAASSLQDAQAFLAASEHRLENSREISRRLQKQRCQQAVTLLTRGHSSPSQVFAKSLSRLDTDTLHWVHQKMTELGIAGDTARRSAIPLASGGLINGRTPASVAADSISPLSDYRLANAESLQENARLHQEVEEVNALRICAQDLQNQLVEAQKASPIDHESAAPALAKELESCRQQRLEVDANLVQMEAYLSVSQQQLEQARSNSTLLQQRLCQQAAELLKRGQSSPGQTFAMSLSRLDTETLKWVRHQMDDPSASKKSTSTDSTRQREGGAKMLLDAATRPAPRCKPGKGKGRGGRIDGGHRWRPKES